jgi:predicted dehydrogenase
MPLDRAPGVAVVGTGFIGPVHVEAVRRLGYQVVGILGSSPERGATRAREMGVPKAYGSFAELIADPAVDVVHITTPNKTHFQMARDALLAGKHVVCEKPLAMNADESRQLVELAAGRPNQVAAVNYNIRFYPLALQVYDLVRAGEIGDVMSVQGSYLQDWLLLPTDWNWRLVPEEGGDLRAVADIGTHWLDLVTFVTGLEVEQTLADMATFIKTRKKPKQAVATFKGKEAGGDAAPGEYEDVEIRTEDYATVMLRFKGGARGVMTVSQLVAGRKNRLYYEVAGTKASLAWDSERPNELWIGRRDKANELLLRDPSLATPTAGRFINYPGGHNEGFPDTFKQLYRAIYEHVVTGQRGMVYPTFEDGHREIALCDAIARSAREERWVKVEK